MEGVMDPHEAERPMGLIRYLTEERRYWFLLSVALGVISFLKGVRFPNQWSATQAQLNYDHGLIKRGLFGETLGRWLHLQHYARFTAVSAVLVVILGGLLLWLTLRMGAGRHANTAVVAAVFGASFSMMYLSHLVGYLDIPLAVLTSALLLIRDHRYRFAAAIPICIIATLLHEMFLIVFLPVLLLSFLVDGVRGGRDRFRSSVVMASILAILCVGLTFRLALRRPLDAVEAAQLQAEISRRVDFKVNPVSFVVLQLSTRENFSIMKHNCYPDSMYQLEFGVSLLSVLPAVSLLLVAIWHSMAQFEVGITRTWLTVAAFVAALSPVSMHLLGWDATRFNALVGLTSLMVLVVLSPARAAAPIALPYWYRKAAICAIALGMVSGEGLLDGAKPNLYPFATVGAGFRAWLVRHQPAPAFNK